MLASSTRLRVPPSGSRPYPTRPLYKGRAIAFAPLHNPTRTTHTPSSFPQHGAPAFSGSARRHPRDLAGRLGGVHQLAQTIHHRRHRPQGIRRFTAAGGDAQTRPDLRCGRPKLEAAVPLRRVQLRDEAHPGKLRRHRLLLLPFFWHRRLARRDRHGVHGQLDRPTRGAQHQRVGQRRRQEGAPVQPVVRPLGRLPHLHHHLEPDQHPLQGGQRVHPVLQALRRPRLPELQAHDAARHAVGRQLLGHREGQDPDRLEKRALRRLLPQLLRQRLRRRPRVPRRQEWVDGQEAQRRRVGNGEVGGAQLHALQLLRGWVEVPAGSPRRVQTQVTNQSAPRDPLLLFSFCWCCDSLFLFVNLRLTSSSPATTDRVGGCTSSFIFSEERSMLFFYRAFWMQQCIVLVELCESP